MTIQYDLPYIEMLLPTKHLQGVCFFHSQCLWSVSQPIPHHFQILLLATFFFSGKKKTQKTVNKVKFKCIKLALEQTKLVPLTIKYVGLASLAWFRVLAPTSTWNIHREKLKFLCPLPSANWTRFSINNLLDIIFMKKEKINTTLFIYLFTFILLEGVWFSQENPAWANFKGVAMKQEYFRKRKQRK